jgi:2,3-dihydroxybenzoate-AMP ligase
MEGFVDWPSETVTLYQELGYWRGITIGDAFAESTARNAGRVAVVEGDRRVTYEELAKLVDRVALHFVERGLCDGARVVFQLPNIVEFVVTYFACLRIGAIPLACLPSHRRTEIEHLAKHIDAAGWFIPSDFRGFDFIKMAEELRPALPSLRHIGVAGSRVPEGMFSIAALLADPIEERVAPATLDAHRPSPRAPAVFQLSGGTTGLPKVIPRTHDDYLFNSLEFAKVSGLDESSVLLVTVPIAHNFPLACPGLQGALLLGGRVVLGASPSPEIVFPLVQRERVTWIPAVPATVITWLNDPRRGRFDLSSIKTVAVGGQRLNPEPARAVLEAFGPVLCQVYGMAEGLLCCTRAGDPDEVVTGTQGRPMSPHDEIRIVGDDGNPVPVGELGELQVRGPYTIRGYFRAEAYNQNAFSPDGFYRTGDLVRMHPSGNVIVEGRSKDVINRGGEKIGAEELENLILGHPAVHNTAVVGVPDPVLGERACAFVVLKPGASLALPELVAFLQPSIAKFKLPERLEVRDALPLTPVGKISKKALREELARRASS